MDSKGGGKEEGEEGDREEGEMEERKRWELHLSLVRRSGCRGRRGEEKMVVEEREFDSEGRCPLKHNDNRRCQCHC